MSIIDLLFIVLIVVIIGYVSHYVITTFFPAPLHMPFLLLVGVLLLVFLLGQFSGYNDLHLYRRWR